jgi:hypothetical protein
MAPILSIMAPVMTKVCQTASARQPTVGDIATIFSLRRDRVAFRCDGDPFGRACV